MILMLAVVSTAVFAVNTLISSRSGEPLPENIKDRLQNAVVFYPGSHMALVGNSSRELDKNPQVSPYYKEYRFMVPAGFLVESLGGEFVWENPSSEATATINGTSYVIKPGSSIMTSDSRKINLGTTVEVKNDLLYVPVKLFSEAVGKSVFYHQDLLIVSDHKNIFDPDFEGRHIRKLISELSPLLPVESEEKLVKLLERTRRNYIDYATGIVEDGTMNNGEPVPSASAAPAEPEGGDYTTTNVQVQGVDEGDIVKTDGRYIYQVNKDRIVIIEAYPVGNMSVVSVIEDFSDGMLPSEIYLDGDTLVVVGTVSRRSEPGIMDRLSTGITDEPNRGSSYTVKEDVRVISYDITDRENPRIIRTYDVEGSLLASRKIGDMVYTVTNKYVYRWTYRNDITPQYRDNGEKYKNISCDDIMYCPGFTEPNYLILSSVNISDASVPAGIYTCLGAGTNVYASTENLYVTMYSDEGTDILKFSLTGDKPVFFAKGTVPGTIINQFSMDEYQGNFRIATTVGWSTYNNLYVLDNAMNLKGKIENIAPGERIYSVRFMGARAYMVTFKTVDPLFVIDVSNPEAPEILGELKIPGYSNYLHPYDENHVLGFGKDTIELESDWDPDVKWAYYQGLKVALFDVTDVANPVMEHCITIGDRGTESELLYNHKALLFSKEKELLAFPVELMEIPEAYKGEDSALYYGDPTFQGLYVYNFNLTDGFTLKGRITHSTVQGYWSRHEMVHRGLYIGNVLYTLSNSTLKAHDLNTMTEIGSLSLE